MITRYMDRVEFKFEFLIDDIKIFKYANYTMQFYL